MPIFVWMSLVLFILGIVVLDLGLLHRKAHVVSLPEALAWSTFWIAFGLALSVFVYFLYSDGSSLRWELVSRQLTGQQAALQFLGGYLIAKSLSIGNVFVIAMILSYFRVPLPQQYRILAWGIMGIMLLRPVMIGVGSIFFDRFDWAIYLFGVLLIASAAKLLVTRHDNIQPERNLILGLTQRIYPTSDKFDENRFFTRVEGRRAGTPLLLALILVATSDIMFAIDAIPATFAITRDPFLVWTSNVFALFGLRSLYFALAGLMDRFRYLKMGFALILVYAGIKLILSSHFPISTFVSLGIMVGILGAGMGASLAAGRRDTAALLSPLVDHLENLVEITLRQGRRVIVLLLGATILLIGAAMIVLPGPAIAMIPLGLGILAIEFAWARRWLAELRRRTDGLRNRLNRNSRANRRL